MTYTPYSGHTTKAGEQLGSGAQAAPGSRRRSRAIRWVAVAAGAAALAIPAAAASAAQPTVKQIAIHEGRLPAAQPSVKASQFPTARQIAMHEGRLPENLSPATAAVAPSSDGNGDTAAIVLFSVALLAGLGSVGVVVARRARIRSST
jgi:hypothetical protein